MYDLHVCVYELFIIHVSLQIMSLESELSDVTRLTEQFEQEVAEASQGDDLQLMDSQVSITTILYLIHTCTCNIEYTCSEQCMCVCL